MARRWRDLFGATIALLPWKPHDLAMLEKVRTKEKAKELLLRLVGDPDQIIRVTTFDMSDALIRSDPSLLKEMCDHILSLEDAQAEPSQDLIARAMRTKVDL